MKIDKEKLQDATDYAVQGQKAGVGVKQVLSGNIEIPEDGYQYDTLDFTKINELAVEAEKDFREISDLILALLNNLNSAENDISALELSYGDENGVHLHIGDNVTIEDGVQYWETGRGEGGHGTVGSEREAGDDFHIDRVAFYVNGQLVANMDETGADIDEYRARFAEEYGVELSDVEMSFCLGKGDGLAAGWVQEGKDISYDELNSQNKEKFQEQSAQLKSDAAAELEATIKGIQEEYAKENNSIESQVKSVDQHEYTDYVPDDISFLATMGESSINVLAGAIKVPVTAVTATVDVSTNLITQGRGTSLTKYEWEAIEELADVGRESMREKGGVNMDDYKTIQEIAGAAAVIAPVAAEVAGAGEVVLWGGEAAPEAAEFVSIGGELYEAGSAEALAAAEAAEASAAATTASSAATTAGSAATTMEGLTAEQEAIIALNDMEAAFAEMGVTGAAETGASTAATVTMEGLTAEQETILALNEMNSAFASFGVTGTAEAATTAGAAAAPTMMDVLETGAVMASIG